MKLPKISEKGQGLLEYALVLILILVVAIGLVWVFVASPIIARTTVKEFDGQLVRYVPELNSNALIVVKNLATGENETFTNEDSLWMWKWNSRDYLALDEGATYHFTVNWFRSASILSQSRNILSATPIGQ